MYSYVNCNKHMHTSSPSLAGHSSTFHWLTHRVVERLTGASKCLPEHLKAPQSASASEHLRAPQSASASERLRAPQSASERQRHGGQLTGGLIT